MSTCDVTDGATAVRPRTRRRDSTLRTMVMYLAIAAFCGLFAAIYEHFSHGMYSIWMVYLFVWPLVGGAVPYAVATIANRRRPSRINTLAAAGWARLAHHAAVATATIGSGIAGALQIYGTASTLVVTYWIAAGALALVALVLSLAAVRDVSRARRYR